ncbi:MAG: 1-phosphofructokinase [Chitinophagaceae bacterium]
MAKRIKIMMSNILTITINPCIDKTIWVKQLVPEKKMRTLNSEVEPGGGGINVARALNYLGQTTTALYFYGSFSGDEFNKLMSVENIPTIPIKINGETRTNILAIDNSTDLEYRFGMDGPTIESNNINDLLIQIEQLPAFEFIVLSGSLPSSVPSDLYNSIAALAAKKGSKIIVDTSGEALKNIVKEDIYLLKPNLGELASLCDVEHINKDEIVAYAQKFLLTHNCKIMVVSLGKDGAYLITKEEVYYQQNPKVEVKSTVGAGDCMVAGMVLALTKHKSLVDVLKMGVACGSAATMYSGYGLCKKEDVENILKNL